MLWYLQDCWWCSCCCSCCLCCGICRTAVGVAVVCAVVSEGLLLLELLFVLWYLKDCCCWSTLLLAAHSCKVCRGKPYCPAINRANLAIIYIQYDIHTYKTLSTEIALSFYYFCRSTIIFSFTSARDFQAKHLKFS